jgi:uncharacterized membrane protein
VTKSRLEAFSDGVFAIAATLLVLDIKVPAAEGGHSLWHALGQQWPSYAAYAVSFFTIGIIWVNHHGQYDRIRELDRTLQFLNLLLLFWVAFIPFPTALVAEELRSGSAASQHTAAAIYALVLLMMGFSFYAAWLHASRRRLLPSDLSSAEVRRLLWRNLVGQFGYVAALVVAFLSAGVSLAICGVVALYYVHPEGIARAFGR